MVHSKKRSKTKRYKASNVKSEMAKRHAHQLRKDGSPYFQHCVNVAKLSYDIAKKMGLKRHDMVECYKAGLCHDVIEDTQTDYEDIERIAGPHIARCVSSLSDDKRLPTVDRVIEYTARLRNSPIEAQIVKLADIMDNISDAMRNMEKMDKKFITRFAHNYMAFLDCMKNIHGIKEYNDCIDKLKILRLKARTTND